LNTYSFNWDTNLIPANNIPTHVAIIWNTFLMYFLKHADIPEERAQELEERSKYETWD
jgi:hypothetical protein